MAISPMPTSPVSFREDWWPLSEAEAAKVKQLLAGRGLVFDSMAQLFGAIDDGSAGFRWADVADGD